MDLPSRGATGVQATANSSQEKPPSTAKLSRQRSLLWKDRKEDCNNEARDVSTEGKESQSIIDKLRDDNLRLEKNMLRLEKQNRQLLDENKKLKVQKQVMVHSEEGLRRVLDQDPSVNMSCFGHNNYKNVSDLYYELQHEICWLERSDQGIRRVLDVVIVRVTYKDLILIESHEQMTDGRVRSRNMLPGVKKRLSEPLGAALDRWIHKELGLSHDCLKQAGGYSYSEQEANSSLSYPIRVLYRLHELSFQLCTDGMSKEQLNRIGLPKGHSFQTSEDLCEAVNEDSDTTGCDPGKKALVREGSGNLSCTYLKSAVHFWGWYQVTSWEAVSSASRQTNGTENVDLSGAIDRALGSHPNRGVYTQLLLRMFGAAFDCTRLSGGFGGGLVLRVQPFDLRGRREEPVIVKLDTKESVETEVANARGVYEVLSDQAARILGEPIYLGDYGAFKLELAGACWHVPELANSSTTLLNTFKDLFIYECEQLLIPDTETPSARRPFGNVSSVISEFFGRGGILHSLRSRGISRQEENTWDFYARKIKDINDDRMTEVQTLAASLYMPAAGQVLPPIKRKVALVKETLRDMKQPWHALVGLAHGDLNGANIIIDAMDAVWLIDFATSQKLPLCTDLAKMEVCMFLEYACVPVSVSMLLSSLQACGPPQDHAKLMADWLRIDPELAQRLYPRLCSLRGSDIALHHAIDFACKGGFEDKAPVLKGRLTTDAKVTIDAIRQALQYIDRTLVSTTPRHEGLDYALDCEPKRNTSTASTVKSSDLAPPGIPLKQVSMPATCFRPETASNAMLLPLSREITNSSYASGVSDGQPAPAMLRDTSRASSAGAQSNTRLSRFGSSRRVGGESPWAMRVPISSGGRGLSFVIANIRRMRRLFKEGFRSSLKYMLHKRLLQQLGGLCQVDMDSLQLWLPLLRETSRIIGYRDVPPWMKLVAVHYIDILCDKILVALAGPLTDECSLSIIDWINAAPSYSLRLPLVCRSKLHRSDEFMDIVDGAEDLAPLSLEDIGGLDPSSPESRMRACSLLSSAEFEEEAVRYRAMMKSQYSYEVDSISGHQMDLMQACANFRLIPWGEGGGHNTMFDIEQCIRRVDDRNNGKCFARQFLISGPPGSGKSCLLRRLVIYCLNSQNDLLPLVIPVRELAKQHVLMSQQTDERLSISSSSSAAAACLSDTESEGPDPESLLEAWMRTRLGDESSRLYLMRMMLASGRLLILMDGLEEAGSAKETIEKLLWLLAVNKHRVVCTVREGYLSDRSRTRLESAGFEGSSLSLLDADQRRFVATARLGQASAEKFEEFIQEFQEKVASSPEGVDFINNPACLSMLLCYWEQKYPIRADDSALSCLQRERSSGRNSSSMGRLESQAIEEDEVSTVPQAPPMLISSPSRLVSGLSTPTDDGSPGDGGRLAISDVYRVSLSVLLQRVVMKHQADRAKVKDTVDRYKTLLETIAFSMMVERKSQFSENDVARWGLVDNESNLTAWKSLALSISRGRLPLLARLTGSKDVYKVYRFVFASFQDFLASEALTRDLRDEHELPSLQELLGTGPTGDDWWNVFLNMVVERSPMKFKKLFERRCLYWKPADHNGDTPLHAAARNKRLAIFDTLPKLSESVRKYMNVYNDAGLLPLHEAAKAGNATACEAMLSGGYADMWAQAKFSGWVPLHFAAANHHKAVIDVLLDAARKEGEGSRESRRVALPKLHEGGRQLASDILSKDCNMTDAEFIFRAKKTFPELSYFRGRSDTTPDQSAAVALDPAEIEFRRTMGALLSVFWVCADRYEDFVRNQPPDNRLSRENWKQIQRWAKNVVKLTNTEDPDAVDAMLCFMSIHDLGKMKDFREELAPGYQDHDAGLSHILSKSPEVLPSYCRLPDKYQRLIEISIQVDFNFGQFLQAENLPANIRNVKSLLGNKGDEALAFYLFHIFADMAGIMGAKNLDGSLFMTETMFNNFKKGLQTLQLLTHESMNDTYDAFLKLRAEEQGLEFKTDEDRAIIRLACCSRVFDKEGGRQVLDAWNQLEPSEKKRLSDYLNRDGLEKTPGFLIYYMPAFLENARRNPDVGLVLAMRLLLRIYDAAAEEYGVPSDLHSGDETPYRAHRSESSSTCSSGECNVITIHIAEVAELARQCDSAMVFKSTFFRIHRAEGERGKCEGQVRLAPWRLWTSQKKLDALNVVGKKNAEFLLKGRCEQAKLLDNFKKIYPELQYFRNTVGNTDCSPDAVHPSATFSDSEAEYRRTVCAMLCIYWICTDNYSDFTKNQAPADRLSRESWRTLQWWVDNVVKLTDDPVAVDAMLCFMAIHDLGKIRDIRRDLSPGICDHDKALLYIIEHTPEVLPSYLRLPPYYQKLIHSTLSVEFNFGQFLQGENLPANLLKVKCLIGKDGKDALSFYLFHIFVDIAGISGTRTWEGSLTMDQSLYSTFQDGVNCLGMLTTEDVDDVYKSYLSRRALAFGGEVTSRADFALARLVCQARASDFSDAEEVMAVWNEGLSPSERSALTEFLVRDGIHGRPGFLIYYAPAFLCNSKKNLSVGLLPAVRMLLKVYETAEAEFGDLEKYQDDYVTIHVKDLAILGATYSAQMPFDQMKLFLTKVNDYEAVVEGKPWIPVTDQALLARHRSAGLRLARDILANSCTESEFLNQIRSVYPELGYFKGRIDLTPDASASVPLAAAEVESLRTQGAMLSIYWVCSNQYDQFVRGQSPKDRLTERSWRAIREWVTKEVRIESVRDAELLDAFLSFTAIHDLGKMSDFRDDVVPHDIRDHDAALGYMMDHCTEVLPSYKSLSDDYKDLIRTCLRVDFNFGQFLQGENLPANLVGVKKLFKDKSNDAMSFFLFHIFADMAGIMGAKSQEGSVFMTETMYNNFARGIEAIQELKTSSPEDVYDRFLLKRAAQSFPNITNREDRAFARLVCLCRIFRPSQTRPLQEVFYSLPMAKRGELVDYLNRDGIYNKPAFLLYYAPAFMENCIRNPTIGLGQALPMLIKIYELVDVAFKSHSSPIGDTPSRFHMVDDSLVHSSDRSTSTADNASPLISKPDDDTPGVVIVHLREVADWAKQLRDSSQFSADRLHVQCVNNNEAVIHVIPLSGNR
ncbi:hypothetical protein FOL47_010776 [Perkinsus chesapeaki]|uniref:Ternary complex associated domain-containing protein n=1 Tax=Perkinsus chesapeaki TaxID=330153 RepID=A0A7J6L0F4_PERCH|nr:hypothetical protein FOL47_010776 [Perkinsus chesapeaki]